MRRTICTFAFMIFLVSLFIGCQSAEMTSAKIYIQQKEYDQALIYLKKEMEKNPQNGEAFFLAGQLYGEMDSLEQMLVVFEHAQQINPKYADEITKWRRSKSARALEEGIKLFKKKKKDIDGAIQATKLAARIYPEAVEAWKNLGFLYQEKIISLRESQQEDSIKYFSDLRMKAYQTAYSIDSTDEEIIFILGGLYNERNMPDSALALVSPLLDTTENPQIVFVAIDAYDKKGQGQEALKMLKKAATLDTGNVDVIYDIASRYGNFGVKAYNDGDTATAFAYFNEAVLYCDKVIALDSNRIDAYFDKSFCLLSSNRLAEAEIATIDALRKDPKRLDGWDQLMIIWARTGKVEQAKTAEKIAQAIEAGSIDEANANMEKLNIGTNIPK